MFSRIYLHIPYCRSKCRYCAFTSTPLGAVAELDAYISSLLVDLEHAACLYHPGNALDSIYFGGGTPSLLSPGQVSLICEAIGRYVTVADDAEITLEANPGTITHEQLCQFRAAGVTRLSLGIQSFDDRMLAILGRIHTAAEAEEAFLAARAAGFDNIGIDLIHALPGQTIAHWQQELEQALLLAPDHLSVYALSIEDGTPFASSYGDAPSLLPDDDLAAEMFERAGSLLTAQGYEQYEIANYARPGFRSRHNSGYWLRDGYLGLGAGAHSFIKDGWGVRYGAPADTAMYAATVLQEGNRLRREMTRLTREDAMAETMFLGLRMTDGIDLHSFAREFGVPAEEIYGAACEELLASGLLEWDMDRVRLTKRGMLLSNRVFSRFLP
jgi:oxygen-independent coproporphyrinogen-3 oxidase